MEQHDKSDSSSHVRKLPHPGAQLRITCPDRLHYTAWAIKQNEGHLAELEVRPVAGLLPP